MMSKPGDLCSTWTPVRLADVTAQAESNGDPEGLVSQMETQLGRRKSVEPTSNIGLGYSQKTSLVLPVSPYCRGVQKLLGFRFEKWNLPGVLPPFFVVNKGTIRRHDKPGPLVLSFLHIFIQELDCGRHKLGDWISHGVDGCQEARNGGIYGVTDSQPPHGDRKRRLLPGLL
jgi:hypothetical protein